MKLRSLLKQRQAGYTLADMGVTIGVLSLLGVTFFQVLQSGLVLFAKNTAVNVAHEEARQGIVRLTRDIHASVAVPQLRNDNFDSSMSVAGSFSVLPSEPSGTSAPMAAGISFQNVHSGPHYIYKDPATPDMIQVQSPATGLQSGMRLIIPSYGMEDNIYKHQPLQSSNAFTNVFVISGFEKQISVPSPNSGQFVICYYTERVLYMVRNGRYVPDSQGPFTLTTSAASGTNLNRFRLLSDGTYQSDTTGTLFLSRTLYTSGSAQRYRFEEGELFLYKQRYTGTGTSGTFYWEPQGVVAKHISSPAPFYIPLVTDNTGGWIESTSSYQGYTVRPPGSTADRFNSTNNNRYVGVKLTARDPKSTNRGYLATSSLLETQIDYRSRLCLYQ